MTWTIRSLLLGVFLLSGCKHTGGGSVTPHPDAAAGL